MTTKTCDRCGAVMPTDKYEKLPQIFFNLDRLETPNHLCIRNCVTVSFRHRTEWEPPPPSAPPDFRMCFNTTGLDFCDKCLIEAFTAGVLEAFLVANQSEFSSLDRLLHIKFSCALVPLAKMKVPPNE